MDTQEVLTRGVEKILPSRDELAKLMAKRKISLYQGFDPTCQSLHIGHLAGLLKLRQFQKLGHKIFFLIGDFTARIGDPTGKISVRKKLSPEEIKKNLKNWQKTAGRIIDFKGHNPAKIVYNSQWNEKISFADLIEITSHFTVQQMIERDMFQVRLKKKQPIFLHEFFYPIAQAIDSLKLGVDLEIGGSDQLFNMLTGRQLVKVLTNKEKYVLTTKLLTSEGEEKMGKSEGNAIFLNQKPAEFYGAMMTLPDSSLKTGFELLTEINFSQIETQIRDNPMAEKKRLAGSVTQLLFGKKAALEAEKEFEKNFQFRKPVYKKVIKGSQNLMETLALIIGSKSQAKRLINSGGVDINGKTVTNPFQTLKNGDHLKIGKKIFVKISK